MFFDYSSRDKRLCIERKGQDYEKLLIQKSNIYFMKGMCGFIKAFFLFIIV